MNYYARDKCMVCKEKPPTQEALWEFGKAHAWLCLDCFPGWKEKHGESLLATKAATHGVARRRFDDDTSPLAACEGLYLAAPHGELMYGGIKTSIVKHRPFPELTDGTFILISDGKAYGLVTLEEGTEIPRDEFDGHFNAHRVTVKERIKWWPESETFWSYAVKEFQALERPCAVEVPSGVQTFLDEVKFLDDDVKIWSVNNPPPCAADWDVAKKRTCVKAANAEYCRSRDGEKAVCAGIAAAEKSEEKQAPVPVEESMETKKLRLDERAPAVYTAWKALNEPQLLLEIDDSHVVIEEGSTFYQVGFTWEDDVPVFSAKDVWIEVERPWRAVKSFVGPDGDDWLMVWTMNAFEDLEEETFTTQAIDDYVERHEGEDTKGRFMFWHLPGTDFGDIKAQAVSGRFLVELGTFDPSERGKAFKQFFRGNPYGHKEYAPTGWGASHGYQYIEKDRKDGVYEWFDKEETSVLPAYAAANPHNPGMEVLKMNDKQRAVLLAIGGEGLVKHIDETGMKLTEDLEKAGITFKALAPVEQEPAATEVKEGEPPAASTESPDGGDERSMETLIPKIAQALQLEGLSGVLSAQTDALKALGKQLTGIDARLAEVEKDDHERLAAKELALPHLSWFQASKAAETVLSQEEKMTLSVPGSPPRAVAAIAEVLGRA